MELAESSKSQGHVTVLSIGKKYVGPHDSKWKTPVGKGASRLSLHLPVGYRVEFYASAGGPQGPVHCTGEVVVGADGGPDLLVTDNAAGGKVVCQVACEAFAATKRGGAFAAVSQEVQAYCQQTYKRSHNLSGPAVWGFGEPHKRWRAFVHDNFCPEHGQQQQQQQQLQQAGEQQALPAGTTLQALLDAAHAHLRSKGLLEQGWFTTQSCSTSTITVGRMPPLEGASGFERAITIYPDGSWRVVVLGLPCQLPPSMSVSPQLDAGSICALLDAVAGCHICSGNPDDTFKEVAAVFAGGNGTLSRSASQQSTCAFETAFLPSPGKAPISWTLRACCCDTHEGCALLVPAGSKGRCDACSRVRNTLFARVSDLHKNKLPSATPGAKVDLAGRQVQRYSEPVLRNYTASLKEALAHTMRSQARMKNKIEELGEHRIGPGSMQMFEAMFDHCETRGQIPCRSLDSEGQVSNPLYELWDFQRKKASNDKASASPLIFRWCLNIYLRSPSAYDTVRQVLKLPHGKTLQKVTNRVHQLPGIQADHWAQMADGLSSGLLQSAPDSPERKVLLMLDEMHCVEGIVEDPKTGEWLGFLDAEDCHHLQEEIQQGTPLLANKILVLMVRAAYGSDWSYPAGYWAYRSGSSTRTYNAVMDVCRALALLDLEPVALVFDGASDNLELLRLLTAKAGSPMSTGYTFQGEADCYFINPFATHFDRVYVMVDYVHCVKNWRNMLASSSTDQGSIKKLWRDNHLLLWDHIKLLHKADNTGYAVDGLRTVRLTSDHIHLNSWRKMRVRLATDVLSKQVEVALQQISKQPGTCRVATGSAMCSCPAATSVFVGKMHELFQLMNEKRQPIFKPDDPRLAAIEACCDWLTAAWPAEVDAFVAAQPNQQQRQQLQQQASRMQPAAVTIFCLQHACYGFTHFVRHWLTFFQQQQPGTSDPGIIPGRFNQDCLESLFSQLRGFGTQRNPTVADMGPRLQHVVMAQEGKAVAKANTISVVRPVFLPAADPRWLKKLRQ